MRLRYYGTAAIATVLAGCGGPAPAPPQAASSNNGICLETNRIDSTRAIDDRHILFTMIDRKVYMNTLPQRCSGLGIYGFMINEPIPQICSNMESIAIPPENVVCALGAFTPYTPPKSGGTAAQKPAG